MSTSPTVDVVRTGRSRRRELLVVAVLLVALLVAAAVGWTVVSRPVPGPSAAAADADVLVQDVAVHQTDQSYVVETVRAVTRGDRAFLLVKVTWFDGSYPDSETGYRFPGLSGTVTHREPYAGVVGICGADAADLQPGPGPGSDSMTVELPCKGLLVPGSVASIELQD